MAQTSQPSCLRCGTPMAPGQRFCSNCGATREPGFSNPTAQAADNYSQVPEMLTELPAVPPPPPPSEQYNQTPPGYTYYPPQQPQNFAQRQQGYQSVPVPPTYAKPQKDATKSVLRQMGCGVLLVILLVLGACGGLSYFVYRFVVTSSSSTSTSTSNTSTNTGSSNGSSSQAVPTATVSINQMITYASIETTILSVQEASSFSNDANANSSVLVRVNLKEHNPTANVVYLFYSDNFRLILPDGTAVAPTNENNNGGIAQDVVRTNWVDFPLSASTDISKLTLRLGNTNEAQMDVPLTGKADVSKYQLKTSNPNAPFQYAGLNWTLTTVTSSWSANGKQADSSMRYIVVTLKVDNPTANLYYPFANDYIRLQGGGVTNAPASNTFDSSIAAGATGKVATVTFLMPQSASSFTLSMLARTDITPSASQVTKDFQI